MITCKNIASKKVGFFFDCLNFISFPAVAILQAIQVKYDKDIIKNTGSTHGISNKKPLKPVTTRTKTVFVPINNPAKYNVPVFHPKPDPVAAKDKTPGPGVIIIKKIAIVKANIFFDYFR